MTSRRWMTLSLSIAIFSCAGTAPPLRRANGPIVVDPLQRGNGDFHVEYAAGRAREEATLGTSRPYFFLGNEKLTLRYRGESHERSLSSARFDSLKEASHVAIAAVSAILAQRDRAAIRGLIDRTREVDAAITEARFREMTAPAHAVVRASIAMLEGALTKTPSESDLHTFGLQTRADQTKLLQTACDELLRSIDASLRQLRPFAGDAWPEAVIVIATDHQSRAEEVGTQYFEHLFTSRRRKARSANHASWSRKRSDRTRTTRRRWRRISTIATCRSCSSTIRPSSRATCWERTRSR